MTNETKTPMIYAKISEVMKNVGAIEKDKKNAQQGYNFRGIDDMYNALNEHLAKAKIFFTSQILDERREERATAKGGVLFYTILKVRWTIYAEDGSFVTTETVGEAMDSGDKSANKAMSGSYKYAQMQVFCIPTLDPKDSENDTYAPVPKNNPADTAKKIIAIESLMKAESMDSLKTLFEACEDALRRDVDVIAAKDLMKTKLTTNETNQ